MNKLPLRNNRSSPIAQRLNEKQPGRSTVPATAGQGVVEYMLVIGLMVGIVVASLALTGVSIGDVFSQMSAQLQGDVTPVYTPPPTPEAITVSVVNAQGTGIPNVMVYAFTARGRYLGRGGRTDEAGIIHFADFDAGDYLFRADFQRKHFWSDQITRPTQAYARIQTGQRPFSVKVVDAAGGGIPNVRVYAFTGRGRYIGVGGRTGADGIVVFDLADGDYKFRADYQ
nr:hypothetical protein [Anaerolineae bacterium]